MADVYGTIGDQPVELNNAASEVTLKALLEVAKAQFNVQSGGKGSKAYKDLEKNLINLAKQAQTYNKAVIQSTAAIDDQTKSVREARKAYEEQAASFKKIAERTEKIAAKVDNGLLKYAAFINNFASNISRMGSSMGAAANIFRTIPVVGESLSTIFTTIADAVESTQKSFIDASSVGANFGGSLEAMIGYATQAGLTIDQFSNVIKNSGQDLAVLATTSASGAKRLSTLANVMRTSGLQDQMAYLGYSLEDINTGIATFSGMLVKGGINVKGLADERLVEVTASYLTNLDAVSKLTGENRKDLEKARQDRLRDSKFRIIDRRLDEESRIRLQGFLDIIGPEFEKGAKDLLMGFANTQEAQDLLVFQAEAGQGLMELGQTMKQTGKLTTSQIDKSVQTFVRGADKINNSALVEVLGGPLAERYGQFVVANMNLERLRGKSLEQIEAEIKKEIEARKEAKDADPASIMRTQQALAKSSNTATEFLIKQTGILTGALDLMSKALTNIIGYINNLIDVGRQGSFTAFLTTVAKDIWTVFTDFMSWLWESLTAIGDKLGKALWNSLPQGVKDWFGAKDPVKEKEKEIAIRQAQFDAAEKRLAEKEREISTLRESVRKTYESQIDAMKKGIEASKARLDQSKKELETLKKEGTELVLPPPPKPQFSSAEQKAQAGQTVAAENLTEAQLMQHEIALQLKEIEKKNAELLKKQQQTVTKNTEATQANTAATGVLSKETKAASACELDYSSPQALFNSFTKIMMGGKAGVTDKVTGASVAQPVSAAPVDTNVKGLAELIYRAEGTSDEIARQKGFASGYDVTYGYGQYAKSEKPLTQMSLAEVREFQNRQIAATRGKIPGTTQGTGAVGKAQITQGTLDTLVKQMGLKPTDIFTPELQDRMMEQLLKGAGLEQYRAGRMNEKQFQDKIAGVWASIGKSSTGVSAYGQPTSTAMTSQLPAVLAGIKSKPVSTVAPSDTQVAAAVIPEATKAGTTTPNVPGAAAPAAGSASTTSNLISLMEDLNSNVQQLVALTNQQLDVSRRTLGATKSNSPNLYSAAT